MSFTPPTNIIRMSEGNTVSTRGSKGHNIKATDDVDSELRKDKKNNNHLVLTPKTEPSTPESEDYENNNVDRGDKRNRFQKPSENETSESSTYEEQGLQLQRHMSQTDNHIHLLDRNGDLNEVAGSQSMLSQELIDHGHDHSDNSGDEEATNTSAAACLLEDLGLEKGSQPESSIGIAKRLGLLPQTQEEEEKEPEDAVKQGTKCGIKTSPFPVQVLKIVDENMQVDGNKQVGGDQHIASPKPFPQSHVEGKEYQLQELQREDLAPASDHIYTFRESSLYQLKAKAPLSGLELLTQVGIKEANKAAAIKSDSDIVDDESISNKAITVASMISIPKTPSHQNEGFGSLLDAVAKITEQEASGGKCTTDRVYSSAVADIYTSKDYGKKRKNDLSPTTLKNSAMKVQRKSETQKLKEKIRREKIEQENEKAQAIAKRAAIIAEQTITDPIIAKKLLLSMALARENPRSVPQSLPGKDHIVQKSFFWVSLIYAVVAVHRYSSSECVKICFETKWKNSHTSILSLLYI